VFVLALAAVAALAPGATFGGLNDPPPAAEPIHVFSVPGAMKSDKLDTVISCTNVDTASIAILAQFFDDSGTLVDPNAFTVSFNNGESLHFATGLLPSIPLSVQYNTGTFVGSARIVATSKKMICTAFLIDNTSNPPVSMLQLPVVRRVVQKGD
jgi:hypothetical protein